MCMQEKGSGCFTQEQHTWCRCTVSAVGGPSYVSTSTTSALASAWLGSTSLLFTYTKDGTPAQHCTNSSLALLQYTAWRKQLREYMGNAVHKCPKASP